MPICHIYAEKCTGHVRALHENLILCIYKGTACQRIVTPLFGTLRLISLCNSLPYIYQNEWVLTRDTLQRQNAENLKQIFPEKEYRGLSPNFHIHVSVSEVYIPTTGLPFLLEEICGPILGIYKSLTDTECGNGAEATQFPEKEYINGITVAVQAQSS